MLKIKSFLLSLIMSIALISHANAQTLEPTPPEGMPDKHKNIVQNIGRALSYQKTCVISKISEGNTAEVTRYMNYNRNGFEWSFINPGGKYNAYLNEYSRYETERIMDEYVEHYNLDYAKLFKNFTDDRKKVGMIFPIYVGTQECCLVIAQLLILVKQAPHGLA